MRLLGRQFGTSRWTFGTEYFWASTLPRFKRLHKGCKSFSWGYFYLEIYGGQCLELFGK